MKIASTTLSGNNETIIGGALASVVEWVDVCIVIDTGATDQSLQVAHDVAREKLVVESYAWKQDFSLARNFALDAARQHGAHWAVTLDTDERIVLNGENLRDTLHRASCGVVMLRDQGGNYVKERAIRLPSSVRFRGPTHEAFAAHEVGAMTAQRAYFYELSKDAEACRKKFERDVQILQPYVQLHPDDPRWHYYLGESLKNLGRFREAISSYRQCTELRGWDEEAAWACFRAAQCHEELGEFEDMLDVLSWGLARHAGLAELPWYAAYAASRLGRHRQAVYWARLATVWGWVEGDAQSINRIGFRHPPGLFEGPYDVLRFALKALGEDEAAQEAERMYERARDARVRAYGSM